MLKADLGRPGPWTALFPHALNLMAHLEREASNIAWSFGGGTVLMLRINHRASKDIDLFVPDPQCLGYVNPRLSDAAESITTDYEENAEFIKLHLPAGEIDIVVGTPLTEQPFELVDYGGRVIRAPRPSRDSPRPLRPLRRGGVRSRRDCGCGAFHATARRGLPAARLRARRAPAGTVREHRRDRLSSDL